MKTREKIFAIGFLMLFASLNINAQEVVKKICSDKYTVTVEEAMIEDGAVILDMDFYIPAESIGDCESVNFTPVLEKADRSLTLQTLSICGVNKFNAQDCYSPYYGFGCNKNQYNPYKVQNYPSEDQYVHYEIAVDLQPWMEGSKLIINAKKCICPCGTEDLGSDYICDVPMYGNPLDANPVWAPLDIDNDGRCYANQDKGEGSIYIKGKDLMHEKVKIFFPVNVTKRVDSYFENADAIAKIQRLDQDKFDVESVKIEGVASPEASVKYNQGLSDRRAVTLEKIVKAKTDFPASIYTTKGIGEYWDDVKETVANSQEAVYADNREALNSCVNGAQELDAKEASLKKIAKGAPYRELYKNVYPRSRFSFCDVAYKVRHFTPEEVLQYMNSRPELICVGEYYRTLQTLEACGEKYNEVLGVALKEYPDCPELNYLAGKCAYERGDYAAAAAYLNKAKDLPIVQNDLGCVNVKTNSPDNAENNFRKAQKGNVPQADENLRVVKKLRFNDKYFGVETAE
jgi:outer membrane protein OmpA-like peptidoglycan-associated protein